MVEQPYLHPKQAAQSFLSKDPDPIWIYLPYAMSFLTEETANTAFKSRVTLKYLCGSLRNFLLEYDDDNPQWEVDTTGEQLHERIGEFMRERGMDIILPL